MKIFIQLIIVIILLSTSVLTSQVRKIVFMEEATNASCAPCAANNPALQEFFESNFGGIISVRYHAWWPGYDPMYNLNIPDNTARINYYGISGVPNYLIDGANYGVPGSPDGMASQMHERLALQSPVIIKVYASITDTTVTATIKLIGVGTISATNLYLRSAVIERMITYASPPGSNGETVFPDVMRELLPNENGFPIASINPGDTLTFNINTTVMAEWNWQDLAVVAWLQTDDTKEVIQSGTNLPTYIVESNDDLAEFLSTDQSLTKACWITNDNDQTLNIRVKPSMAEVPTDWSFNLVYNGTPTDSVDLTIAPGETAIFDIAINTGPDPGTIKLKIFAQNLDDQYNYGYTINYFGVVKKGFILFVDDDGTANSELVYRNAFETLGYNYTEIQQSSVSQMSSAIHNENFEAVFWSIGWGFPAFVPSDLDFLEAYLDGGGQLYLAGQDIGWDIFDNGGTQQAKDFYHNYLDANYISDDSGILSMEGVAGTIFEGISFGINNVYPNYPEDINSFSGSSPLILNYAGSSKYGSVAHDATLYKTIYIGIGLEQVDNTGSQISIIQNSLEWFDVTIPVELASFTSTVSSKGVTLDWTTATELNNHGFEIERSYDGTNFFRIAFVQGFGTTTQSHNYTYIDKVDYTGGKTLYYRLKQVDYDGSYSYSTVLTVEFDVPSKFVLNQNYPNPFNPTTKITYAVPKQSPVLIKVFDLTGQEVITLVDEVKEAGTYEINFDALNFSSGVYIYQMRAGDFSSVKKMSILK